MIVQPKFFPVSPDLASKMVIAARLTHGVDVALELAGAIMRGLWAEDRNIGDEDTLALLAGACELDGRALIKSAETASVQAEYDRNTEDATAASVFGSPWYVLDGESFWGQMLVQRVERRL